MNGQKCYVIASGVGKRTKGQRTKKGSLVLLWRCSLWGIRLAARPRPLRPCLLRNARRAATNRLKSMALNGQLTEMHTGTTVPLKCRLTRMRVLALGPCVCRHDWMTACSPAHSTENCPDCQSSCGTGMHCAFTDTSSTHNGRVCGDCCNAACRPAFIGCQRCETGKTLWRCTNCYVPQVQHDHQEAH